MFIQSDSRKEVKITYPQAEKICKCDGGFMVFFSRIDYLVWKNQK